MACLSWRPSFSISVGLVCDAKPFRGEVLVSCCEGNNAKLRGSGLAWRSDGVLLCQFPSAVGPGQQGSPGEPWTWTGRSRPFGLGDVVELVAAPPPDAAEVRLLLNGEEVAGFPEGILSRSPVWRLAVRTQRSRLSLLEETPLDRVTLGASPLPPSPARARAAAVAPAPAAMASASAGPAAGPAPSAALGASRAASARGVTGGRAAECGGRAIVGFVTSYARHHGSDDTMTEVALRNEIVASSTLPLTFRQLRFVKDAPLRLHEALQAQQDREVQSAAEAAAKTVAAHNRGQISGRVEANRAQRQAKRASVS